LTANGHNLTDNLFRWAVFTSLEIIFDNVRLREYCQAVNRNNVASIRNQGTKRDRENSNSEYQKRLDEGNKKHEQEREEARLQEKSRTQKIAEELAKFTQVSEREVAKHWESTFFNTDQKKTWASFLTLTKQMEKRER
jgi:hypothetical protein